MVLWNDDVRRIHLEHLGKSADDGSVEGHAPLNHHGRDESLTATYHALEISCQSQTNAGENVGQGCALLLEVGHV